MPSSAFSGHSGIMCHKKPENVVESILRPMRHKRRLAPPVDVCMDIQVIHMLSTGLLMGFILPEYVKASRPGYDITMSFHVVSAVAWASVALIIYTIIK